MLKITSAKAREWLNRHMGALCFVFLLLVTSSLGYYLVYEQADIIQAKTSFFALSLVLISLAFIFSSVEAAFSVSNRHPAISEAINPDLMKMEEEWARIDEKSDGNIRNLSADDRRRRNSLEKKADKVAKVRQILMENGGRRVDTVGALSAVSVLANTALAAFLPLFIDDDAKGSAWIGSLGLDQAKLLIFVASALPIIFFGKIVPKTIGLRYPAQFAYRFFAVGNAAYWTIGWMPRGLNWLVMRLRLAD